MYLHKHLGEAESPLPSCPPHTHPLQFLEGQFQEVVGLSWPAYAVSWKTGLWSPGASQGGLHPEDADRLEQQGGLGPARATRHSW